MGGLHLCGMPANKYALLRYRIIDRSLRSKNAPFPSKEDLRQACEDALYGSDGEHISMSTIDKDLWAMRNEGELGYYAPIKFSKAENGYFYENPDFTIAEVPLTNDDLEALKSAAQTLYQFREIPLFKHFDAAIEKIMDRMKISLGNELDGETEIIQFERAVNYVGSEFLEELFRCCSDHLEVKLVYQRFDDSSEKQYVFHPYILKEYKGRWYVIGFDPLKSSMRTFSLDRIKLVESSERSFSVIDSFDSQQFFDKSFGITVTQEKSERVVLKAFQRISPYIISQPLHKSQKITPLENGEVLVELDVLITIELVSEILGFGAQIEVVEPVSLQRQVKQMLSETLNLYL